MKGSIMNDTLNALCAERDALVIETCKIEDLYNEYTLKHDLRKWSVKPVLEEKYIQLADIHSKIEALFRPEPKKSFLKRLFKK